jgi:ubiquinone/menaquinone biosynthesis C-methylase UbiE
MNIHNSPPAEQAVSQWEQYLRASIVGTEVTEDFWHSYGLNLDKIMEQTHKLDRGLREVSGELSMRIGDMEDFFRGKSVLDIGCGTGKFANDVARIKKTKVVALDHDSEVLDRVPTRPNLEKVLGSGYALAEVLADREFDVVVSSFSSVLWARNTEQREQSMQGMFTATALGGTAIILPYIANPTYRFQNADRIIADSENTDNLDDTKAIENLEVLKLLYTSGAMDLVSIDALHEWEQAGAATVGYRESLENKLGKLIQERYSAVVTRVQ